jgi:hypothetical protein
MRGMLQLTSASRVMDNRIFCTWVGMVFLSAGGIYKRIRASVARTTRPMLSYDHAFDCLISLYLKSAEKSRQSERARNVKQPGTLNSRQL